LVQNLYKVYFIVEIMKTCISTGSSVVNMEGTVTFSCPSCGKDIVRSGFSRKNSIKYECTCGFRGL